MLLDTEDFEDSEEDEEDEPPAIPVSKGRLSYRGVLM
jgi:hypothetical protein